MIVDENDQPHARALNRMTERAVRQGKLKANDPMKFPANLERKLRQFTRKGEGWSEFVARVGLSASQLEQMSDGEIRRHVEAREADRADEWRPPEFEPVKTIGKPRPVRRLVAFGFGNE